MKIRLATEEISPDRSSDFITDVKKALAEKHVSATFRDEYVGCPDGTIGHKLYVGKPKIFTVNIARICIRLGLRPETYGWTPINGWEEAANSDSDNQRRRSAETF